MEQKTLNKSAIKALAFDFGGTLDSPFKHWMDVYLDAYNTGLSLGIDREEFLKSYVFAEREMERLNQVNTYTPLFDLQAMKTKLQCDDMISRGVLSSDYMPNGDNIHLSVALSVVYQSYLCAEKVAPTLDKLSGRYPLLLVSNYYGNIRRVLHELKLDKYFSLMTDSTIEGVRKPDPELWHKAIKRAGFAPSEVVVIGDSLKNDVLPAQQLGCQAIHCVPEGSSDSDNVSIHSIAELENLLLD
jgi:putative hydrolase of the HAD superfamily